MSAESILLHREARVAWITFNNPARHNAMSLEMWRRLAEVVERIAKDSEVRCIVLRGAGDKAFISGADVSEFAAHRSSAETIRAYDIEADRALDLLTSAPQPLIAMIHGYCFGGGMAIALSCDVRLASDRAIFSIPAARLGLCYGHGGTRKLLDAVGPSNALDMLISARRYPAEEALSMGLVTRLHDQASLETETHAYAGGISENAPLSVQAAKGIVKELRSRDADISRCERLVATCFASEDYAEGVRAFSEKRAPKFCGR